MKFEGSFELPYIEAEYYAFIRIASGLYCFCNQS
jgi:hypothetical protein